MPWQCLYFLPGPLGPVAKIVFGMGRGRENAPDGWDRILAFFDEHVAKKSTM